MAEAVPDTISFRRKLVGAAGALSAAGAITTMAIRPWGVSKVGLASAAVVGLTALGVTRRSLVAQVLSRGALVLVLVPSLIEGVAALSHGHVVPTALVLALSSGTALVATRPLLETRDAHAAFAPRAFRGWLLAGSIALAAAGLVASLLAFASFAVDTASLSLTALAVSYFASAIGVVRMRSWGVFLGGATSLVLLAMSLFLPWQSFVALWIAAMPALLCHTLPILIARYLTPSRHVPVEATEAVTSVRWRVAGDTSLGEPLEPVVEERAHAAALRS